MIRIRKTQMTKIRKNLTIKKKPNKIEIMI